jgi:histidine ammonia-lyase/tyrosine ammonia-lyase
LTLLNTHTPVLPAPVLLGPDIRLSCETVERVAYAEAGEINEARLTESAVCAMTESCRVLEALQQSQTPVYGTTTGFGPFVAFASATNPVDHGAGLLAHLGAGWGPSQTPWTSPAIVKATMLIRAQNMAQGFSAVTPDLVRAYLQLLEKNVVACVPSVGSVGASGDLIPLAHIARVLTGDQTAKAWWQDKVVRADEALRYAELRPVALSGREALALTNGTSFLTGYAALSVARGERLLTWAERLTGWAYRLLGARTQALNSRLHHARGHAGQVESARAIWAESARFEPWEDDTRALQEVYSLRCAPQILGACRENVAFARRMVETEINGVSDNPLFFNDLTQNGGAVAHGGNFHGQQVAFASDALNAALTQIGVLAERQIALLVTPSVHNENAPLLLSWESGAQSGLAGAQLTATALVAEMRSRAQMHATFSIPTNGNNQDVVSMGTLAARAAWEQTERLAGILAVLALALNQLNFLRQHGKAQGRTSPPPVLLPPVAGLTHDRALYADIAELCAFLLTPQQKSDP